MPESEADVSISSVLDRLRRRARGILFLGSVGVLLYLLWDIARLFLIAALIAYLLDPLVRRLQGTTGRTGATLLVLGIVMGSLIGIGIGVKPVLQQQVGALRDNVQIEQVWDLFEYLEAQLSALSTWLGGDPVSFKLRGKLSQQFKGEAEPTIYKPVVQKNTGRAGSSDERHCRSVPGGLPASGRTSDQAWANSARTEPLL